MLRAIILTLALATASLFHSSVRSAFYFTCPLVMIAKASLMICLADRLAGFLIE